MRASVLHFIKITRLRPHCAVQKRKQEAPIQFKMLTVLLLETGTKQRLLKKTDFYR